MMLQKAGNKNFARKFNVMKEYRCWVCIRQRCANPRHVAWSTNGALGIKVVPEWLDFRRFLSDMGHSPEGTELARLDRTKDYGPGNCIWVSPREHLRMQGKIAPLLLPGDTFGYWTVSGEGTMVKGNRYYPCTCKCGVQESVADISLRHQNSYGCRSCMARNRKKPIHPVSQPQGDTLEPQKVGDFWVYKCTCGTISMMSQHKLPQNISTLCRDCKK